LECVNRETFENRRLLFIQFYQRVQTVIEDEIRTAEQPITYDITSGGLILCLK